ncbi:hypothetical protein HZC53_00620 [Candidatus Uhrbacteria bacterium]|nr:hypothetical protein [Candidatus Uhrbacteria bacterium]
MENRNPRYLELLASWESVSKELWDNTIDGARLLEFLWPYYECNTQCKPASPDLEQRTRELRELHWAKGIHLVHTVDEVSALSGEGDLGLRLRGGSIWDAPDDRIESLIRSDLEKKTAWGLLPDTHSFVRWSLLDVLFWACQDIFSEERLDAALKYKPFLDLFLVGNFPVGFNKEERNILVLVAD